MRRDISVLCVFSCKDPCISKLDVVHIYLPLNEVKTKLRFRNETHRPNRWLRDVQKGVYPPKNDLSVMRASLFLFSEAMLRLTWPRLMYT